MLLNYTSKNVSITKKKKKYFSHILMFKVIKFYPVEKKIRQI